MIEFQRKNKRDALAASKPSFASKPLIQMWREQKNKERQEKRRAHYEKKREKIIAKVIDGRRKCQSRRRQLRKIKRECTVRYICGPLAPKRKGRRPISQVPLEEHEQILASL
ncbi:hypothetical protein ACROYT_G015148 [Oculina patagonica]